MIMAKQSIASKMKATQEELKKKMSSKNEKPPKKKRKTVKEQYKEIKESLKGPSVVKSDNYEEDLIKSLFNENSIKSIDSEDVNNKEKGESKEVTHRDGLWDYVIEDEIEFFDPECSYELTGYKPITETKGLDFNPDWFTEAARTYTETGKYTEYPAGSKPYADYWMEQLRRCSEGYEVNGYRLTGDNYFFLNFYRMPIVDDKKKLSEASGEGFPKFVAEQYKFFHYFEMCELLKKDVVALKSRGIK